MSNVVYLKPNVLVEPLFNNWYAWPYLIFPGTAAMYVANSHLKIMQSFASAPHVHVSALRNPKMIGGPFINCAADKVGRINALIDKTLKELSNLIELAEAVKELDQMLAQQAEGHSLEPFYLKIPSILRGYIELSYDLNNRPSFRFLEGLLYKSHFYKPELQSIALSLIDKDDRHYAFSTPVLDDAGNCNLHIPFSHKGIDELFAMRANPQTMEQTSELLGVDYDHKEFSELFTDSAPDLKPDYSGERARIRYFGHSCVLVEAKGTSILCDPVISYNYDSGIPRFTYEDLPSKIDYVLITHNHQDHCSLETLLQLRHKIGAIVVPANSGGSLIDPSLKMILRSIGFNNVFEIGEMETFEVNEGSVTGLPFLGEHADLNIRSKMAYLIRLNGSSLICAADSNNIEPVMYNHLREIIGSVDALFLGMECEGAPLSWVYGPLLTRPMSRSMDQSRRFDGSDCEKAIKIVESLTPSRVYVYAMGLEPWLRYLIPLAYNDDSRPITESNRLIEYCNRNGIKAERLYAQNEILLG